MERAFLEKEFSTKPIDPRPNPVRDFLSSPGDVDLIHFAGHGCAEMAALADAKLLLQGRIDNVDGQQKYVEEYIHARTVEQFANLTGEDGSQPIVVLNACQVGRAGYRLSGIGGFAQAFLRRGAGVFVGTLWSVGDKPARTFVEAFYLRLKNGERISRAAIAARKTAMKAGDATWLAYTVYGNPHASLLSKS